jgi:hypothetical protein
MKKYRERTRLLYSANVMKNDPSFLLPLQCLCCVHVVFFSLVRFLPRFAREELFSTAEEDDVRRGGIPSKEEKRGETECTERILRRRSLFLFLGGHELIPTMK